MSKLLPVLIAITSLANAQVSWHKLVEQHLLSFAQITYTKGQLTISQSDSVVKRRTNIDITDPSAKIAFTNKAAIIVWQQDNPRAIFVAANYVRFFSPFQYTTDSEGHILANHKFVLDLNRGTITPLSSKQQKQHRYLQLKLQNLRDDIQQQQQKMQRDIEQHRLIIRESFRKSQKLLELVTQISHHQKTIQALVAQKQQLKPKFTALVKKIADLEKTSARLYRQIQKREQFLKIVDANLIYVQQQLKQKGANLLHLREEIKRDSNKLIDLIIKLHKHRQMLPSDKKAKTDKQQKR